MPRRDIAMSDAEVDDFLAACELVVVGAIDADGWPVGSIAANTFADGRLSLSLPAGDPVLDAIEGDGRICCVADEHETYYEIRGVVVHAAAQRVGSSREVIAIPDRVISFDFARLR